MIIDAAPILELDSTIGIGNTLLANTLHESLATEGSMNVVQWRLVPVALGFFLQSQQQTTVTHRMKYLFRKVGRAQELTIHQILENTCREAH